LTTVGKAQGRITMDLSSHRPLNSTLSSNPSSMPSTTSSRVVERVKYAVRSIAAQNSVLPRASM
jgi:hypothetical protein